MHETHCLINETKRSVGRMFHLSLNNEKITRIFALSRELNSHNAVCRTTHSKPCKKCFFILDFIKPMCPNTIFRDFMNCVLVLRGYAIKFEIEIKPMNILSNNFFWDDALVNHTIQMFSNFLIHGSKL